MDNKFFKMAKIDPSLHPNLADDMNKILKFVDKIQDVQIDDNTQMWTTTMLREDQTNTCTDVLNYFHNTEGFIMIKENK